MAGCNGCDGKGTWFSPIRGDIECDRCGGSGELAGVKPDKNGDVVPQHVWKSAFDRYRNAEIVRDHPRKQSRCVGKSTDNIAKAYFPNMTEEELYELNTKAREMLKRIKYDNFVPAFRGGHLTHFSFVDPKTHAG